VCNAAAIGIGLQIIGTAQQSRAESEAGEVGEDQARAQASLAKFNEYDAKTRGKIEETLYRRDVKMVQGAQRTAIGASGFASTGDLANLVAETAAMGEMGARTIRATARREAYGYKLEGQAHLTQGSYVRAAARNNSRATLLTGTATAVGMYDRSFN
jgi:hypothetical protein